MAKQMLLIYVPRLTNRLGYTINVVMSNILRTDFAITTNQEIFLAHEGPRLCYAPMSLKGCDAPFLKSTRLLFETTIEEQECRCFVHDGVAAMFPVYGQGASLPFDPLAAIFYMLSRYEEYLPYRKDEHGRFMSKESVAYKNGFLQTAVVERWAMMVRDVLLQHYPDMVFNRRDYEFVPTVDIDAAYCYLHKGLFRTTMGLIRDGLHRHDMEQVRIRMAVLRGKKRDPFDTFDYIIDQCGLYASHGNLVFFALVGDYGIYDKPASSYNNDFRMLLQHLGDYAKVGVHGSYYSSGELARFERETQRLADIMHRPIVRNRYHFLRFNLPDGYHNLIKAGVSHDYTMGYAETVGFRNGSCSVLPFFDLGSDSETSLMIHPFMAMDTTLRNYMNLDIEAALRQMHSIVDEVRSLGGTFSCIFHNQNLAEDYGWNGWRKVFEDTLQYAAVSKY